MMGYRQVEQAALFYESSLEGLIELAKIRFSLLEGSLRADALDRLRDDAQHPADATVLLGDGRIRNVEVHGFAVAAALDVEGPAMGNGSGLPTAERTSRSSRPRTPRTILRPPFWRRRALLRGSSTIA